MICQYCGDKIYFSHVCHLAPGVKAEASSARHERNNINAADELSVPIYNERLSMPSKKKLWDKKIGCGFVVHIKMHTYDTTRILSDPGRVREFIGAALDKQGLQEEIDYTLEVKHIY